jgi:hypothetical protein
MLLVALALTAGLRTAPLSESYDTPILSRSDLNLGS